MFDLLLLRLVSPQVVGNSGFIVPEMEFLQGLRKITEESGAVLCFDEVMTVSLSALRSPLFPASIFHTPIFSYFLPRSHLILLPRCNMGSTHPSAC